MSESDQYLYKIQPTRQEMLSEGPTPEEEGVVGEHFTYLQELTARGLLILAGRTLNTDESSFGIVIFRAFSEEAAQKVMENDPAVRQDVMKAEIFPFRIALMSDTFNL